MSKLIRLELRRTSLRTYLMADAIIFACVTGMLFLFSYAAQVEQEPLFQTYSGLFLLISVLNLACFGILSAVMFARFVISEYSGKRAALLFSYPVSRRKVLLAKVIIVTAFTVVSALVCGLLSFGLFAVVDVNFLHQMNDVLTPETIMETSLNIAVFAIAAACIGLIAMRIGFIRRSVPATLVTAFLLPSLLSNSLIAAGSSLALSITVTLVFLAAGLLLFAELSGKINRMEAL